MGLLDEAIREHLELKRQRGASESELARQEREALGPATREAAGGHFDVEDDLEAERDVGLHELEPAVGLGAPSELGPEPPAVEASLEPEATELAPEGSEFEREATGLEPRGTELEPEATGLAPEATELEPEGTELESQAPLDPDATQLHPVPAAQDSARDPLSPDNGDSHDGVAEGRLAVEEPFPEEPLETATAPGRPPAADEPAAPAILGADDLSTPEEVSALGDVPGSEEPAADEIAAGEEPLGLEQPVAEEPLATEEALGADDTSGAERPLGVEAAGEEALSPEEPVGSDGPLSVDAPLAPEERLAAEEPLEREAPLAGEQSLAAEE